MPPIVETERLCLREFRHDDLDALAAMVGDPEQMRFYPATRSREEASAWLERTLAGYSEPGLGIWVVESREDQGFAGYCGLRPLVLDDGTSETEIGWHIHKSFWGRGLATEAARAARDTGFGRYGLERIIAIIPVGHQASYAVAERLGMRVEREASYEGEVVVVYALERA